MEHNECLFQRIESDLIYWISSEREIILCFMFSVSLAGNTLVKLVLMIKIDKIIILLIRSVSQTGPLY
jgi:hypothetical protein